MSNDQFGESPSSMDIPATGDEELKTQHRSFVPFGSYEGVEGNLIFDDGGATTTYEDDGYFDDQSGLHDDATHGAYREDDAGYLKKCWTIV